MGIDCRDHRHGVIRRDIGRREAGEGRETDRRLARGERNAARRRDADAQAGEAARAGGDCDAIEVPEFDLRVIHHARDQRHHRLGMPARER